MSKKREKQVLAEAKTMFRECTPHFPAGFGCTKSGAIVVQLHGSDRCLVLDHPRDISTMAMFLTTRRKREDA